MKVISKILKWILWGSMGLVITLSVLGWAYQQIAQFNDLSKFPPPGKLIDVNGHLMHLHCQGEGSPTVVVEQGLGTISAVWHNIHKRVSLTTRICGYDRVGMGYSEPTGRVTSSAEVAQNLHKLLQAAGIDDDIVLVGWSAGGVYIREYYQQHPDAVKGMVLVDSSHEQQAHRLPKRKSPGNFLTLYANYLAPLGIIRLSGMARQMNARFKLPDVAMQSVVAQYNQSHMPSSMMNESKAFKLDIQWEKPLYSLGDLPLIVLAQGKPIEGAPNDDAVAFKTKQRLIRNQLQKELAALSSKAQLIIAEQSGHAIHNDQPDLLVQSIENIVLQVRAMPVTEHHHDSASGS
jgi:pimeloyl-ACP methyl ester carboxylesterase